MAHRGAPAGLQDVEGAAQVDLEVVVLGEGAAALEGGAQVVDRLHPAHRGLHVGALGEAALDQLDAEAGELVRAPVAGPHQATHLVAPLRQPRRQIGADAPRDARDQDLHAVSSPFR